jgi:hypothetical protein
MSLLPLLPNEILLKIFNYSDLRTKLNFKQLNKKWSFQKVKYKFFKLIKTNCDNNRPKIKYYNTLFQCINKSTIDADNYECYIAFGYHYNSKIYLITDFNVHGCHCEFVSDSDSDSDSD